MKCSKCGNENKNDFKYCEKCGSELDTIIICPSCNTQNDNGSSFCKNCGKSINTNTLSQPNQDNPNYQHQNSITSNKIDLKALLAGSIPIPIIIWISYSIIDMLYNSYVITLDGEDVLMILSIVLAGTIGMIIFNKLNREETRPINIVFVTALSIIMFLIISALNGGYGFNLEFIILLFIFIGVGAFIGDYIVKNGRI